MGSSKSFEHCHENDVTCYNNKKRNTSRKESSEYVGNPKCFTPQHNDDVTCHGAKNNFSK